MTPEANEQGVSLFTHFTALREADIRALEVALTAVKESTAATQHQTDKWQASANEWRQAMNDKDRNFITVRSAWGYLVGIIGFVVMILAVIEKIR